MCAESQSWLCLTATQGSLRQFAWGICQETWEKSSDGLLQKQLQISNCCSVNEKEQMTHFCKTCLQLMQDNWGKKGQKQVTTTIPPPTTVREQLVFSSVCENWQQCIISSPHVGLSAPLCRSIVYGWFWDWIQYVFVSLCLLRVYGRYADIHTPSALSKKKKKKLVLERNHKWNSTSQAPSSLTQTQQETAEP